MAKKSLLAEITKLPDGKRKRKGDWVDFLRRAHPDFTDEVLAIIQSHLSGDPKVWRAFPYEKDLSEWLAAKIGEKGHTVSAQTVREKFRQLRSASGG